MVTGSVAPEGNLALAGEEGLGGWETGAGAHVSHPWKLGAQWRSALRVFWKGVTSQMPDFSNLLFPLMILPAPHPSPKEGPLAKKDTMWGEAGAA